jgi:hypothetical protein
MAVFLFAIAMGSQKVARNARDVIIGQFSFHV